MRTSFRTPFLVLLAFSFFVWGQNASAQSGQTQPTSQPTDTPQSSVEGQAHPSSPGRDVGRGAGDIGKGTAKGAGAAAKGVGKGAGDLVTLHPLDAAGNVGKGAAVAGKDVGVGAVKGTGKIAKGTGGALANCFIITMRRRCLPIRPNARVSWVDSTIGGPDSGCAWSRRFVMAQRRMIGALCFALIGLVGLLAEAPRLVRARQLQNARKVQRAAPLAGTKWMLAESAGQLHCAGRPTAVLRIEGNGAPPKRLYRPTGGRNRRLWQPSQGVHSAAGDWLRVRIISSTLLACKVTERMPRGLVSSLAGDQQFRIHGAELDLLDNGRRGQGSICRCAWRVASSGTMAGGEARRGRRPGRAYSGHRRGRAMRGAAGGFRRSFCRSRAGCGRRC